ncbi:MAG: metallophosphoesterase family protein [Armatimonadota bacterium]
MSRARFLHTADLHLGRPFGFLPPQLAEERRRDQRRALTRICDLALERDVDLVIVAGDLFDAPDPDPTDLEAVTAEFLRLAEAGKRIFAVPGNHDSGRFWPRLSIPGLHVFSEPEWRAVTLDDLGIAVCGIATSGDQTRAFEGYRAPDLPTIAVAHASFESFEGQIERYNPFSAEELPPAEYVALGHYHRFNPVSARACYPGTPEGIGFDQAETEDRHVVVGEITKGSATFEPVKINRRVMKSVEIDCTSFESQVSLFDAVRRHCDTNALLKIKFTGAPLPEVDIAIRDVPERFRESCLHLAVDQSGLSTPTDLPMDDATICGRFCKQLLSQIESTADPERRRLLHRALEVGIAAFAGD